MLQFLRKQSFQPNALSVFINPLFFIRRSLFKAIKLHAPSLNGKLLDFGCGRKPYENIFRVKEYIGIDIKQSGHDHTLSKVDIYYDGKHIPFENDHFDSVYCGEVLEHVFTPDETITEIKRVIKKGGVMLLTIPFCWNEHEIPYDFARYTSYGITHLLEKHNFEIISINKTGSFLGCIFQLCALYFFDLFKKYGAVGYMVSLIFIAPINIIGIILLPFLPKNKSLYFNTVVLARKIDD
jgi:SAM-dependent methyltransferase